MSYTLTGERVSSTYGRLIQIVSGSLYDGFGNIINVGSSSNSGLATTASNVFIGDQIVSGSITVTSSIIGNLTGTSSYAVTASYAENTTNLITGSNYPITASWAVNVTTASVAISSSRSTFAETASYALNGSSGGNNPWTASSNNIYFNTGYVGIGKTTPTTQLDITGSITITGSSDQNLLLTNADTLTITGSILVTGSIESPSITASLLGTSSYSNKAISASWAPSNNTASYAITASYAMNGGSGGGSSQWTSSGNDIYFSTGNVGVGKASPNSTLDLSGSMTITGSSGNTLFYSNADTLIVTGSILVTGSTGNILFEANGDTLTITGSVFVTGSIECNSITSSLHGTSSYSISASWAPSSNSVTASYAITASYAMNGGSGGGSSQWTGSSNNIYFNTGYVGIGKSNPNSTLDVSGSINITGSSGNILFTPNADTLLITGSILVTGSIESNSITSSLLGTASYSFTSSYIDGGTF